MTASVVSPPVTPRLHRAAVEAVLAQVAPRTPHPLASEVHEFVGLQFAAMPPQVRAGVDVTLVVLLATSRGRVAISRWEASRLVPARQYVRLLRSLVLLAVYDEWPPRS
jgi:hypothetical protein